MDATYLTFVFFILVRHPPLAIASKRVKQVGRDEVRTVQREVIPHRRPTRFFQISPLQFVAACTHRGRVAPISSLSVAVIGVIRYPYLSLSPLYYDHLCCWLFVVFTY